MFYKNEFLAKMQMLKSFIDKEVEQAIAMEREACAKLAEVAGLGEPHSLPPYSVRELIAHEIRNRGSNDRV
jgi:hypothetical protein